MAAADPVAIAQALVRCRSVTPDEGGALAYLEGLLKRAGFDTHRVAFDEPGTPPVENFFAKFGAGAPHLVFAGHTDVVPASEETRWRHGAFSGEVADGNLYGRGAGLRHRRPRAGRPLAGAVERPRRPRLGTRA